MTNEERQSLENSIVEERRLRAEHQREFSRAEAAETELKYLRRRCAIQGRMIEAQNDLLVVYWIGRRQTYGDALSRIRINAAKAELAELEKEHGDG